MSDSILSTIKKMLGLDEAYKSFDPEIVVFINGALADLNQLGIGPDDGFMVVDETQTWADLLGTEKRYSSVQTFVYLKVRLAFDPPQVGYVITSMEKMLEEATWRISAMRQSIDYPTPLLVDADEDLVIDGGDNPAGS